MPELIIHHRVVTNADRIRCMTDEELENFFVDLLLHCTGDFCHNCPLYDACFDVGVTNWLKQEVTENGTT